MDSGNQPNPNTRAIPSLIWLTSLRDFPDLFLLDRKTILLGLSRSVTGLVLRCRAYNSGTGISTCFPFEQYQLRLPLGPTNPQLTNSAEEPLLFRRQGFSPCSAATLDRILIPERSIRPYGLTSTRTGRLATGSSCESPWYR